MKFSTSKKELQEALQKLSKAPPTRTTLPILNCVLIKATNEKTSLRTTDLELTIDLEISVSIEEEGSAAVPLKQLYDITSELPETRITIIVDNKNKTEIKTNSGSYDLMGKQKEEFPATPKIDETKKINIPGKTLRNIIESELDSLPTEIEPEDDDVKSKDIKHTVQRFTESRDIIKMNIKQLNNR